MGEVAAVLAPVFVASFALQQLIELLDPVLDTLIKRQKKWILSAVTLVVALGDVLGSESADPVDAGCFDSALG